MDTYETLKASYKRWSHRDDIDDLLDDIIAMVESEMINPSEEEAEPLRVRQMEQRSTAPLTTTSRFLALPPRYVSMRRLRMTRTDGVECELVEIPPEALIIKNIVGPPGFYSITSQLEFDRIPDAAHTIEMQFYQAPTGLSSANMTNDILTNYPQIYLNGGRWKTNEFGSELTRAEFYKRLFYQSISGANFATIQGRHTTPQMRHESPIA